MRTLKTCTECNLEKPLDDFHRRSASRDERQSYYKSCMAVRDKQRNRRWDAPARRERYFRQTYGLSLEDIEAMKVSQNGVCAICSQVPERWVVDHCHETGRVRGALCDACNTSIGLLRDDPNVVMSAAAYLLAQQDVLAEVC